MPVSRARGPASTQPARGAAKPSRGTANAKSKAKAPPRAKAPPPKEAEGWKPRGASAAERKRAARAQERAEQEAAFQAMEKAWLGPTLARTYSNSGSGAVSGESVELGPIGDD